MDKDLWIVVVILSIFFIFMGFMVYQVESTKRCGLRIRQEENAKAKNLMAD